MRFLKTTYLAIQRWLERRGIYVAAARVSARNRPELINRAIWTPLVVDDHWRAIYHAAQRAAGETATDNFFRQARFYSLYQMAAYAASLPAGDVIECGCWHGNSTYGIATVLTQHQFPGRFHVFDSFEGGLSAFTAADESAFQLSDREKQALVAQFHSDYERVRALVAPFGFVEFHRGWIPQSFAGFAPRPLRFVHVDVDMYEPTKAALDLFWEWLVPGGCIVVDDYNYVTFAGATRAVDEFVQDKAPRLFYKVPCGSCYLIK